MRLVAVLLGSVVLLSPVAGFGASEGRDFGAVFAPDGKTVAFVHADGGSGSIDLVDANGSHRRVLVPRVSSQHLAWSPDGTSLAYDTDTSIWRVDLATATPVRLTTDDPTQDVESWQPAWSPDGTTIAYSRFQTCFRCTAIWLMNSDGTSPRQIYDDGNFQARRPTFSHDGTRLALSLANDLVIDLDGNSIVAGGGAYTIWSPHDTYVAYTGSGGLWIRNLLTGTVRRLTRRIGAQIAWSPDAKWIAGGLRRSVALVHARDGSHLTKLPASSINGGAPSFSHGLVAYTHTGKCGIDIAREDGTNPRRLTRTC